MWKPYYTVLPGGESLLIRTARPADAHAFVDTLEEVSREGIYLLNDHAARSASEQERIIRLLDYDRNIIAVAMLDNKIVGGMGIFVGGLSQKTQSFCNLGIHLIKDARSKGVGTRLMAYGINWAAGKSYHKICLSVFSTNARAVSLYCKMGFVTEGIRKEQYYFNNQWVDEILMAKFL